MSSATVSQLLSIAAPRAEAKPQQSSSSQDGQFQDLLARASSTVEGPSKPGTDTSSVQQADEPLTDSSEQDTSSQYDEASTNSEAPADPLSDSATESPDAAEESQSDAIELSEAVELVLAAQIVPEQVAPAEAATQPALEASVIDAPAVGSYENLTEPESQATTAQLVETIEVTVPANQYGQLPEEEAGTNEQAVVVEATNETDPSSQEGSDLPTSEMILESDEQPAAEATGEASPEQAENEPNRPTTQPAETVVDTEHAPPATAQSSAAEDSSTEQSPAQQSSTQKADGVAEELRAPEESGESVKRSQEPKETRARDTESAQPQPEAVVAAEEAITAGKETLPAPSSPSSPAVVNPVGDGGDSRSPTGPTVDGSAASNVDVETDVVSTVDRARFVQRVGRAFQAAHGRDGQIQLRLSPPELGSMRISISVQEGVVSAKVEVETGAARNILLDNLPALRERLAEQEIRIEKFDVDVSRDGGQEPGSRSPDDRQAHESPTDLGRLPHEREADSSESTSPTQQNNPIDMVTDGGLDVRI